MKTCLLRFCRLLLCMGLAAGTGLITAGCENDSGDSVAETTDTPDSAVSDSSDTDAHFPDGLHPDSSGDATIASVFARYISTGQPVGDNDPNTVVCLGDSITEGGYPGNLAGATGMTVIDEGEGGEKSSGGASRVSGVLSAYKPAYLCILYGANDVINGVSTSESVANLQSIVDTAKANNTIPIIGTLTPMSGDYAEYDDAARALSSSIRSMASSSGISCADIEGAF